MQDYYYISDSETTWDYPNENQFIDSISLESFQICSELLSFAEKNSIRILFFEDYRINNQNIQSLLNFYKYLNH
jgi:hypothetical protein